MSALLDVKPLHQCPQHPATPDFFGQIARLDKEGDWRTIYANAATGEVRYATDEDGPRLPEEVLWFEGEAGPEYSGGEGLTIFHAFESCESLDSCHYQWWLSEISGPCLIGFEVITDPDDMDANCGWAFMVREL